jgi:membrane-bound lytic murein transglycosylase B
VITRYNHSHLYAMAVYQLAKALGLDSWESSLSLSH